MCGMFVCDSAQLNHRCVLEWFLSVAAHMSGPRAAHSPLIGRSCVRGRFANVLRTSVEFCQIWPAFGKPAQVCPNWAKFCPASAEFCLNLTKFDRRRPSTA